MARGDGRTHGRAYGKGNCRVTHDSLPRTALVVFVDQTECPWLRVLRRGFRHCFAAVSDGSSWIVCDPLKDRMEINLLRLPADFDLAGFYAGKGYEVLIGHVRRVPCRDRLALAPMTCVARRQAYPWAQGDARADTAAALLSPPKHSGRRLSAVPRRIACGAGKNKLKP